MEECSTIARSISARINLYLQKEDIELLKMTIGIEIILINTSKILTILLIACFCGILQEAALTIISFALLRRYAFGLHSQSSVNCTIIMIIMDIIIPMIFLEMEIGKSIIFLISIFLVTMVYKYAPSDTEKLPLLNEDNRKVLRKRSVMVAVTMLTFATIIPFENLYKPIFLGTLYAVIYILPTTYKLLNQRRNNYEFYE